MKKKVINHALKISGKESRFSGLYTNGSRYFVSDNARIMELDGPIASLRQNDAMRTDFLIRLMDNVFSSEMKYVRVELPTVDAIMAKIREMVGRKTSINVAYFAIEEGFVVNARWLCDAMKALNASCCFYSGPKSPIYIFENDDVNATIKEAIATVVCDVWTYPYVITFPKEID